MEIRSLPQNARIAFASLVLVVAATLLAGPSTIAAQAPSAGRRPVTIDDYDRWRSIESTALAPDGVWMTFAYGHRVGDDTLQVQNLDTGSTHAIPRATEPVFSDDSRWLAYRIEPEFEEARRLRREEVPLPLEVGLLDLETGRRLSWSGAEDLRFAVGSGHLAIKKAGGGRRGSGGAGSVGAADGDAGTDLILRDLARGLDRLIGSVGEFAFNQDGSLLAYTIDAADRHGNGVVVVALTSGIQTTLDQTPLLYSRLTWDGSGTALAALKGETEDGLLERRNALVAFRGLDGSSVEIVQFGPGTGGVPDGRVLSQRTPISWKADRSMVFVGLKSQRPALKGDPDNPRPNVDVFHWRDARIQSVQRVRARADRNFTFQSAIDLTRGRFVALTDSSMRDLDLSEAGSWGVGRDGRAYVSDWKETRADYYRVDTSTGERTLIAKEQGRTLGLSPDGAHFAFWRGGHVWLYTLATGELRNLTESAPVSFVNEAYDRPGTKPPYGLAGWTSDGEALVLNGRYDVWRQPLDGSPATDLTGGFGEREEVRLRIQRLDPEEKTIDFGRPLILSAYGEWTKKSGFFELSGGRLRERIFGDRQYAGLIGVADAERYLFTSSTFAEFPDVYVTDGSFRDPVRVTDANPHTAEFTWGHRILIEFENKNGVRLQGTLAIPDGYEPGERLPMIVNFYEKKSQELHSYYAPMFERGYPAGNVGPVAELGAYTSHGYLVLQPDVYFNTGTTHSDMLDCVTAATRKVIELGYADPDRIVLTGGSFSGGGSAFIATQTDMFAAIASRAAPINLAGEFDILFSGSGQNNHSYDIYGQGRYGTNPFDDFELYRAQSPITHVANMNTPLLYLHGKQDGSVEYLQGMEFYNALRFLGKPIIFLSYPDEGHNLHRYENQRDYTERLWQFIDHYLKDAPAPDWMTKGVPFLDRGY